MRVALTNAYDYLLSGKVTVTFLNTGTGNQFTFYIYQKQMNGIRTPAWYVYHNRNYIGIIRGDVFITADKSVQEVKTFDWVWRKVVAQELPDTVHILHDGKCGRCARTLTDALSIQVGIGPECRKKLGINIKKYQHDETGS